MREIVSRQNPQYRRLIAIADEKGAEAKGFALIEGYRLCLDAIESGISIDCLVVSNAYDPAKRDALTKALAPGTDVLLVPDAMFRRLASTKSPQGVACAFLRPQPVHLDEIAAIGTRFLVLENVQDPGNVGAMVRTADAMGFDGVIVLPGTADPFGPKAIRSAMGSTFHLPLYVGAGIGEAVHWLHAAGCRVYAGHLDGKPLEGTGLAVPGAVIIGNEGAGLTKEAAGLADSLVRIPMRGRAESLNAACAAAILCYSIGMTQENSKEGVSCTPL